jgi:hypothetical protein
MKVFKKSKTKIILEKDEIREIMQFFERNMHSIILILLILAFMIMNMKK